MAAGYPLPQTHLSLVNRGPPMLSLNSLLKQYFDNDVKIRETEVDKSDEIVQPLVKRILRLIGGYGIFQADPICLGSHFQGLEAGKSVEFDYAVKLVRYTPDTPLKLIYGHIENCYDLKRPSEKPHHPRPANYVPSGPLDESAPLDAEIVTSRNPLPPSSPGYVTMSHRIRSLDDPTADLCFDGDLIPFKVRRELKRELTAALEELRRIGFPDIQYVDEKSGTSGPAITFTIDLQKPSHHPISVDFAPIIDAPIERWDVDYPRELRWPSPDTVQRIKATGIRLVAKKNCYWQRSYALCERELVGFIFQTDARDEGCRTMSHRIMKKLNADFWCNTTTKVITSYMLKNIWFWECEEKPHGDDWASERLEMRIRSMIARLLDCIIANVLPLYFDPRVNLLKERLKYKSKVEELATAQAKIQKFLDNIALDLQTLFSELKH